MKSKLKDKFDYEQKQMNNARERERTRKIRAEFFSLQHLMKPWLNDQDSKVLKDLRNIEFFDSIFLNFLTII